MRPMGFLSDSRIVHIAESYINCLCVVATFA